MYHLFSEYGDCYDELSDSVHYMNINAEIKHKQPQCLNWTGTKKYVLNENAFWIQVFGNRIWTMLGGMPVLFLLTACSFTYLIILHMYKYGIFFYWFKKKLFCFLSGTISQKDLKDLITNNQSGGIVDIPSDQLPIDSKELINDFNPGDLNILFSKL